MVEENIERHEGLPTPEQVAEAFENCFIPKEKTEEWMTHLKRYGLVVV
jgi:hypothetical protein